MGFCYFSHLINVCTCYQQDEKRRLVFENGERTKQNGKKGK